MRSVINRENMCKGQVAGRNLAHPASHSKKSKVCVTRAQEQEVEWYKTKARGFQRQGQTQSAKTLQFGPIKNIHEHICSMRSCPQYLVLSKISVLRKCPWVKIALFISTFGL